MTAQSQAARMRSAGGRQRVRIPVDELRARMIQTALDVIDEGGGLTVSLAHLNMEEIIRLAGVPRSSVYREWETKEAFYVDLMVKMVEPTSTHGAAFDQETLDTAVRVVESHQDRLNTAGGRREVLCEAIRQAVKRNFDALQDSFNWRTMTALVATLPSLLPEDHARILAAVTLAEEQYMDRMAQFYEIMIPLLGLRLKAPFTTKIFAATASSVVEGMVGRSLTNPDIGETVFQFPGIGGQSVEWHLGAIGYLAVIDAMVEPDPTWAMTDLATHSGIDS